jgi:amino acid transporter
MLMILVVGCFLVTAAAGTAETPLAGTAASVPWLSMAMLFTVVPALRAILTAFDGWYAPIYMAEENTDPTRTLPRGSMAFLIAAVVEDPRSGIISAVFVGACVPVYAWLSRGRRLRAAASTV